MAIISSFKVKRLFFALWPDPEIREKCVHIQQALGACEGNVVSAQNLHITLVFLGAVKADTEAALCAGAAQISVPALKLEFDRLSFWNKSEVLCLTASRLDPCLLHLVEALKRLALDCGLLPEARPYTPHVSLFRKVKQSRSVNFETLTWHSSSFSLVESRASLTGVKYHVGQTWK